MSLLRIAAIVLAVLALICAVASTAIAEAGWEVWFLGAFLALVLDGPPLNINIRGG